MQLTGSSPQSKSAPGPGFLQAASRLLWPMLRGQSPVSLMHRLADRYGEIVRIPLLPGKSLFLLDHPYYFKHVLIDNHRNYVKASPYGLLKKEFGNGLLYNTNETWQRQRRMLQPGFHRKHVAGLTNTITDTAEETAVRWRTAARNGEILDVDAEMAHLTRRVTSLTLLSADISDDIDAAQKPVENNLTMVLGAIPGSPQQRRIIGAIHTLNDHVYRAIARRRAGHDRDKDDLLNMLLDARDRKTGEGMDDEQIRDEIITFIYAGYDTTSRGLTWTWYLLGQHPDVFARLKAELDAALNGRSPTFADLKHLPYTRMVTQESLRLMAPIWAIGRQAQGDDELDGYHIPAGAYITMSPYITHRHRDFWENPEQFDPERFTPERSQDRDRLAYVPFGMGQRLCIGKDLAELEMPLIVAVLAQQFHPRPLPDRPVIVDSRLTLQPRHGLPMKIEWTLPG